MGNGSAMRVAPLGAYFADRVDQPAAIMAEAEKSAVVTHPHPEGVAGAQAIALAAALAVRRTPSVFAAELWPCLLEALPSSRVRDGATRGSQLGADARLADVAGALGNGSGVICPDTVPVCLWLAAHSGGDFEMAMRRTATISGDIDTNCAIVGGIVCLLEGARLPHEWRRRRMPVLLLAD
jgi:ADP-ribosylglycohydrolase